MKWQLVNNINETRRILRDNHLQLRLIIKLKKGFVSLISLMTNSYFIVSLIIYL